MKYSYVSDSDCGYDTVQCNNELHLKNDKKINKQQQQYELITEAFANIMVNKVE